MCCRLSDERFNELAKGNSKILPQKTLMKIMSKHPSKVTEEERRMLREDHEERDYIMFLHMHKEFMERYIKENSELIKTLINI